METLFRHDASYKSSSTPFPTSREERDANCVPRWQTGKDMRDCCSELSLITCNVFSSICFVMFVLSLFSFGFALKRNRELRKEKLLVGLYASISLSLLLRGIYFLNFYFKDMDQHHYASGYCAYIVFQVTPIGFVAIGAFLFILYAWYMGDCAKASLSVDERRLESQKARYHKMALAFAVLVILGTLGFSISDCIPGDYAVTNTNFTMIVFLVLSAGFLSSGYKLLKSLHKYFRHIYDAIKVRVFFITVVGGLAMLTRAVMSTLYVFFPEMLRELRENSLLDNDYKYPLIMAVYFLICEILPLMLF